MDIARKRRVWYPGAIYHIIARGNRRQNIYKDESDYQYFYTLLNDIRMKMSFDVHAYCFMTNHFHLLIGTKDVPIWNIMKPLMQFYTEYYNHKYHVTGHLFQGRYHSYLVENIDYFRQIYRYIHWNPVRAEIVSRPEEYPWSSIRNGSVID